MRMAGFNSAGKRSVIALSGKGIRSPVTGMGSGGSCVATGRCAGGCGVAGAGGGTGAGSAFVGVAMRHEKRFRKKLTIGEGVALFRLQN